MLLGQEGGKERQTGGKIEREREREKERERDTSQDESDYYE